MEGTIIASELAISTGTTAVVATSVSADPLLTVLIGFGVSFVTMVGGEFVKLLVAYLKKKREKIEKEEK